MKQKADVKHNLGNRSPLQRRLERIIVPKGAAVANFAGAARKDAQLGLIPRNRGYSIGDAVRLRFVKTSHVNTSAPTCDRQRASIKPRLLQNDCTYSIAKAALLAVGVEVE